MDIFAFHEPHRRGKAAWVSMSLGKHWTAAYRLRPGSSPDRAGVAELRIVPGQPGDFDPEHDYEEWEADMRQRRRTLAPFSFTAVRRGVSARHLADAFAVLTNPVAEYEAADRPKPPALDLDAARPGRPPKYTRRFYAAFAVRYEGVEHASHREPGTSTRAVLADAYNRPVNIIGKWIRTARQLGFLTPVKRGQRGGRATNAARNFPKRGQK